jgi:hypothetical protein
MHACPSYVPATGLRALCVSFALGTACSPAKNGQGTDAGPDGATFGDAGGSADGGTVRDAAMLDAGGNGDAGNVDADAGDGGASSCSSLTAAELATNIANGTCLVTQPTTSCAQGTPAVAFIGCNVKTSTFFLCVQEPNGTLLPTTCWGDDSTGAVLPCCSADFNQRYCACPVDNCELCNVPNDQGFACACNSG